MGPLQFDLASRGVEATQVGSVEKECPRISRSTFKVRVFFSQLPGLVATAVLSLLPAIGDTCHTWLLELN